MSVHTPGPWGWTEEGRLAGPNGYAILAIGDAAEDILPSDANARLIAAAPELLRLLKIYAGKVSFGHDIPTFDDDVEGVIAKATGAA